MHDGFYLMQRGIATFTLDHGQCPDWLFQRMVRLGQEMCRVIVDEYGPDEFIKRLGDPIWFQSLGTVLAFDWNASGLTTILTAALKEAIRGREHELGIYICGGKGKTSRQTPQQIRQWGNALSLPDQQVSLLEYNSRMSAKVDSALVQDDYQIYHHSFMFSRYGSWTVVQQGMNTATKSARRYHWHSANINDLVVEPHSGIFTEVNHKRTLNLTAQKSESNRSLSVEILGSSYRNLTRDLELLDKHIGPYSQMLKLGKGDEQLKLVDLYRGEFKHHLVEVENFSKSKYLQQILYQLNERQPKTYEELVATKGVGPKTVRALALVGEVLYGAKPSYRDPARYSFAHGGKDATPYPVDRATYDKTIATMRNLVSKTKLNYTDKSRAIQRLA